MTAVTTPAVKVPARSCHEQPETAGQEIAEVSADGPQLQLRAGQWSTGEHAGQLCVRAAAERPPIVEHTTLQAVASKKDKTMQLGPTPDADSLETKGCGFFRLGYKCGRALHNTFILDDLKT